MKPTFYICFMVLLSFYGCSGQEGKKNPESQDNDNQEGQTKTFTNPLLPSGPDPYSTYHNGYYHYTSTEGNKLVLKRVKNLANLGNCLLYTSDAADDLLCVDLGDRRIIKKKKKK